MIRLKRPFCARIDVTLTIVLLLGSCWSCIAQGNAAVGKPSKPDILDANTSSSTNSRSGQEQQLTCTSNIKTVGVLPVARVWTEKEPAVFSQQPLSQGACIGYKIMPAQLEGTACETASPDNYILVEFWQLSRSNGSSSSSSTSKALSVLDSQEAADVKVLVARGTQPWLSLGPDGNPKVTPPIRDADTGLTPVGTFQDDAAVVYNRPAARVFFPTNSPMTDVGEPLESDTWYITIAVDRRDSTSAPLPGYAIRASCIATAAKAATTRSGKTVADDLGDTTDGVPCPVATPEGPQCSGRGVCRAETTPQIIENSRYCDCDSGFGSYACQLPVTPLPLNKVTEITVSPGQWGYYEVTLPGLRESVSGPGGPSRDAVAAAAAGLGQNLVGNEELLVTAERLDADKGFGGSPLMFLKPFQTKSGNQPTLDALDVDVVNFADLRSFHLQLNKHYQLQRDRVGPIGASSYAMPRRWYVAIFNANATRVSEPVRLRLNVQYRDLNRQPLVCPFNCSGNGRCVDPKTPSSLMPLAWGMSDASIVTAPGPMQEQSPLDAGFMCVCNPGYGGLTCEGRMQNVTVGAGEQKLQQEVLQPGEWYFYIVTVDAKFNPQSNDLGIRWLIGDQSSPPSANNYSNAFISFDQGPLPSRTLGGRRYVIPGRKKMTSYSKLIANSNDPLPLQVPGNQLSPGGTYVVSIFNNDYTISQPFVFSLTFFVMADNTQFLHPYMSILLGVTAAVILCLAMTLCKRVVMRYGFAPWRWRQRRRELLAAAANGGQNAQGTSLSLVLMAQSQQSNRGVPADIYQAFPCRPYALKDYQQRQHDVQQQQQQLSDVSVAPDQPQSRRQLPHQTWRNQTAGQPGSPVSTVSMVSSGISHQTAVAPGSDIEQQEGARVVELAAGAGRQPFHARLSQLSQQLSMQFSGAAVAASPTTATAAAAAGSVASSAANTAAAKAATTDDAAADDDLTMVKDDDAPSCTVCLGEYVANEMVRQLPCGHEFHQVCIDQWMANHGTCPICRAPLWPGAYEVDDDQSDDGSDSGSRSPRHVPPPTPANIYVHHEMPAGGFMGGLGAAPTVSGLANPNATANDDDDIVTSTAAAAGGGVAMPAAGVRGSGSSVYTAAGINDQRLQQQQHWHPLQQTQAPVSTGTAIYSGEQAQQQQQQNAAAWSIPTAAQPSTWLTHLQEQQVQQQQQQPRRQRHGTG